MFEITTPPKQTKYFVGENIDYTGIVVSAVYDDGTQHDVTAYCDFEPAQGSAFTDETNKALISCAPPLVPYVYDYASGYVYRGKWTYQNSLKDHTDIYKVVAGHTYFLTLGKTVGTSFCAMFTTTDISKVTSNVSETNIRNTLNPNKYDSVTYTPSEDGYIAISKDGTSTSGLKSYLYDTTTTEKTEVIPLQLYIAAQSFYLVGDAPTKTAYHVTEPLNYSGCKL